jgi:HPt (histidine-containing phosphotransfer) domain-containing protein
MSDTEKVYDLSMLREMDAEDPGTLKHILQIFLESIPVILNELLTHFADKDYFSLGNSAHKLKSSLELISMKDTAILLKKIELQSKSGQNLEEIPAMVETVEKTLLTVFEQLKQEIE